MLVQVTVSSCSDPFSVNIEGNLGMPPCPSQSRQLKISTLVLAFVDSGLSLQSAGEIVEALTKADISDRPKTILVEMSEFQFNRFFGVS
jgi:hypothetical protein